MSYVSLCRFTFHQCTCEASALDPSRGRPRELPSLVALLLLLPGGVVVTSLLLAGLEASLQLLQGLMAAWAKGGSEGGEMKVVNIC